MSYLITDISKHDGAVNFTTMAKKAKGVIIRAGYRGYTTGGLFSDRNWKTYATAAPKTGLPIGVYWYGNARSVREAQAEADMCLNLMKGCTVQLGVWLDLEYSTGERLGITDHQSSADRTTYAIAWMERIKTAGYPVVGIYCNQNFWREELVPARLSGWARWIAHYGSNCNVDCDIWQYSSTASGSAYGASAAHMDLNRCYTDFIGGARSKFDGQTAESVWKEATMNTIKKGYSGDPVKLIQHAINIHAGETVVEEDGKWGALTDAAFGAFQAAFGLADDRVCGVKSWAKVVGVILTA